MRLLPYMGLTLLAATLAHPASATVITFDLPKIQSDPLGTLYSQDGFNFMNGGRAGDPHYAYTTSISDNLTNISQTYHDTTNWITSASGQPFSFQSIGLADDFSCCHVTVQFIFDHVNGTVTQQTVNMDLPGNPVDDGLQIFTFDQNDLSSVEFRTLHTAGGGSLDFNLVGVNDPVSPVPEPVSLTILGSGLIGLGVARRGRSGRAGPSVSV